MNCSKCGANSGKYPVCWKCRQEQLQEDAYNLGFQAGVLAEAKNKTHTGTIDKEHWRRLAQLCHPDKHNGSQVAIEMQQWLNSIKPQD